MGQPGSVTSDAIIYLPGIMGSELVDAQDNVVWGLKPSLIFRQALFGNVLDRLALRPSDGIRASRPIQFPSALPMLSSMEPYQALDTRLKTVVLAPQAIRPFAYDWRKSIADAADALAPVARKHLSEWQARWRALSAERKKGLPEPGLTLVGHSMGGLVASYFAAFGDGGEKVSKVVTLGTPFGGSLNAVNVLATGKAFPLGAFADALRDAAQTLPGLYELLARWNCVVDCDGRRALTPADVGSIGASRELATAAAATIAKLDSAFETGAEGRPPVRSLIGTRQPTLQTVSIKDGVPTFFEAIDKIDERGDGTVFRAAAAPPGVDPAYLPQSHGALSKTNEAVEYVAAKLTERSLKEYQALEGVGVRVPEIVIADQPFFIDILDGGPGLTCSLTDCENNQLVTVAVSKKYDGLVRAQFTVGKPGLFRIAVSAGGFSAVEKLACVLDRK
jgi:pimeloyl-ACP methyl ester carboxylesterase